MPRIVWCKCEEVRQVITDGRLQSRPSFCADCGERVTPEQEADWMRRGMERIASEAAAQLRERDK